MKLTKTLLVMKLTAILLLVTVLQVSASGKAQSVTYSTNAEPLEKVLAEIKKQTGVFIVYWTGDLKETKPVTVSLKNAAIKTALEEVLKNQPLNFRIENNTVLITKKTAQPVTSATSLILEENPPITVKGQVVNEKGEAISGASIMVKGSKKGASSNSFGAFSLTVEFEETLIISAIGYETIESKVTEQDMIITLKLAQSKLDEVVYKGYYSTSRKLNTGAVSTVGSKEIQTQPVTNPLVAISGRMSGINILQTSGMPGGGVNIQIRGRNSLRNDFLDNGNFPLYVIDGVPFPAQIVSSTFANSENQRYGSPLNMINPADIERIDILKDADATAAYGSRGANGVVLITTKKGRAGKMSVTANVFTGFGKISRKIDLLNTKQYLEIHTETAVNNGFGPSLNDPAQYADFPDIKLYDSTSYIDWQDFYLGGTARFTNAQAGFSGGSENVQYLFNSTFSKEGTVMPGDKNIKKGLFNLNLGFSSNDKKFKANFSTIYSVDNTNLPTIDPSNYIYTPPHAPAAYINNEVNWDPRYQKNNPVADLEKRYNGKSNNLVTNSILSYNIIEGLTLRLQAGYNKLDQELNTFNPLTASDPSTQRFGSNAFGIIHVETYNIQPEIEYNTRILSGDLSFLASSTWQQSTTRQEGFRGLQYTSDLYLENLSLAPILRSFPSLYSKYNYNGFLGKITYNYANRYVLNLIGRRDGSSRFGMDQQFGNFGSVGAAWIFTNESFLKNSSFLSFGKLRGSYGTTGSDQIGDYQFFNSYQAASFPYNNATGLVPARIANPSYSWEVSKKMDVALELGFLQDRIFVSTGYYRNRTSKQLVGYPLPPNAGSPTGAVQANSPALVQNTGVEIDVNTKNIKRELFSWTTNINFTIPKNKLVSYPDLEKSSYASRLMVGQPLSIARVYEYTGVDPQTGLYTVKDQDNDGVFNSKDYIPVFRGQKAFGGILNSLVYRNFQLDVHFQFVKQTGYNIYNYLSMPGTPKRNYPVDILDRWQKPGDNARFQKLGTTDNNTINAFFQYGNSSAIIGDASFVRMKNLSLSYSLPSHLCKSIKAQQLRIYTNAQNLLTITNYEGFDPELANSQAMSTLKTITFGIQCVF